MVSLLKYGEKFTLEGHPQEYWGRNYLSILENLDATANDIDRLVSGGWLEGPLHYRPWLVTPLGAVVKADKFRLVVDRERLDVEVRYGRRVFSLGSGPVPL